MGVRGLQTFLEQWCPESCYSVDIGKLAHDYKCKTGKDAQIVVDAQSCYNLWCRGMDWLVGFEIQELIYRLGTFVESFKKLGIQLIFFFGGLTPEKKRNVWIQRRRKNLDEIHIVFDILKEGRVIPKTFNSIPPNMGITTSYILKYVLGCEVYTTVDECDEEIIDYVHKHNCFGIFGQDTDFIVSEVNTVILSSKNFNAKTMTTLLYDRVKLARHLGIRPDQLPLLALLAGNDMIPYSTIQEFHRTLCGISKNNGLTPFQVLMPAIARYINKLPKNLPLEKYFEHIAADLFNDSSQIKLLEMSYNSYFVKDATANIMPENEWSRILYIARWRHKNSMSPSILYSILSEQIFECSTAFEDLRIRNDSNIVLRDQPSSTVTRPLRSRLYGVLLFEKEHSPITVQEWCGENINSYLQSVWIEPIKPSAPHPGLIILWSDNNNDRINDMRWQLFLTSVCPTLKVTQWQSLDDDLLLTALSVYYLYNEHYLDESEVDAILTTVATHHLYTQCRLKSLSYNLDFRAAEISVTLIRTYGLILTLLAACGYPIALSRDNAVLKFEGKLFQVKYAEMKKNKENYSRNLLCEKNSFSLWIFYRMRRLILPEMSYKRGNQHKNDRRHYLKK